MALPEVVWPGNHTLFSQLLVSSKVGEPLSHSPGGQRGGVCLTPPHARCVMLTVHPVTKETHTHKHRPMHKVHVYGLLTLHFYIPFSLNYYYYYYYYYFLLLFLPIYLSSGREVWYHLNLGGKEITAICSPICFMWWTWLHLHRLPYLTESSLLPLINPFSSHSNVNLL